MHPGAGLCQPPHSHALPTAYGAPALALPAPPGTALGCSGSRTGQQRSQRGGRLQVPWAHGCLGHVGVGVGAGHPVPGLLSHRCAGPAAGPEPWMTGQSTRQAVDAAVGLAWFVSGACGLAGWLPQGLQPLPVWVCLGEVGPGAGRAACPRAAGWHGATAAQTPAGPARGRGGPILSKPQTPSSNPSPPPMAWHAHHLGLLPHPTPYTLRPMPFALHLTSPPSTAAAVSDCYPPHTHTDPIIWMFPSAQKLGKQVSRWASSPSSSSSFLTCWKWYALMCSSSLARRFAVKEQGM